MSLCRGGIFCPRVTTDQLYPSVTLVDNSLLLKQVFMVEQNSFTKGQHFGWRQVELYSLLVHRNDIKVQWSIKSCQLFWTKHPKALEHANTQSNAIQYNCSGINSTFMRPTGICNWFLHISDNITTEHNELSKDRWFGGIVVLYCIRLRI